MRKLIVGAVFAFVAGFAQASMFPTLAAKEEFCQFQARKAPSMVGMLKAWPVDKGVDSLKPTYKADKYSQYIRAVDEKTIRHLDLMGYGEKDAPKMVYLRCLAGYFD